MNKKDKFDQEEADLTASYEAGEWQPVGDAEAEIERYRQIAETSLRKDQRVNIRISSKDLLELRKRALEEGIPYQTLMASILHKYVSGTLVARSTKQ